MTQWTIEYQGPDKKARQTVADVPDHLVKATDVVNAIESGDVADIYITPGAILSVQKCRPPTIA